jgi:hypothetical protein
VPDQVTGWSRSRRVSGSSFSSKSGLSVPAHVYCSHGVPSAGTVVVVTPISAVRRLFKLVVGQST